MDRKTRVFSNSIIFLVSILILFVPVNVFASHIFLDPTLGQDQLFKFAYVKTESNYKYADLINISAGSPFPESAGHNIEMIIYNS